MRVLFLIEELGGGGKERRLVELLKGLSKDEGFNIHLILTKNNNDYPIVNQLPINIHYLNGYSDINLVRQYNILFKNLKPDIVHTWTYKTTFYATLLKPFYKFKLLAGFIGDTKGQSKKQQLLSDYFIYKHADLIISNTSIGLKAHKVPLSKGCVVVNGFDPNRLKPSTEKSKITLKSLGVNTPFTIVMVANVRKSKDYKTFISVAKQMTEIRDDVTFISIGSIHPEYQDMVSSYRNNKHDRIKFIGFHDAPEDIIQESDIGLLCSNREGMSNSILEYMAAGLPVVTTDLIGGSKELIVEGKTGFICAPEYVYDKLCLLLDNKDLRVGFGEKGSFIVNNKFSLERMVKEYINLYK